MDFFRVMLRPDRMRWLALDSGAVVQAGPGLAVMATMVPYSGMTRVSHIS